MRFPSSCSPVLVVSSCLLLGCGSTVHTSTTLGATGTGGAVGSTSSSTTGGSTGTGGSPVTGDCSTDADCAGSTCAELTPGGYKVCLGKPPEATMCNPPGPPMDQCCTSADCQKGKCYGNLPYCGGAPMPEHNVCVTDACQLDADCGTGSPPQVCIPAGAFGRPARTCLLADCRTSADCKVKPGGYCAPMSTPCCGIPSGLGCVYPGGCHTDHDCAPDGSSYCAYDPAQQQGVCYPGPAPCPG
jgi:hypothetical protein